MSDVVTHHFTCLCFESIRFQILDWSDVVLFAYINLASASLPTPCRLSTCSYPALFLTSPPVSVTTVPRVTRLSRYVASVSVGTSHRGINMCRKCERSACTRLTIAHSLTSSLCRPHAAGAPFVSYISALLRDYEWSDEDNVEQVAATFIAGVLPKYIYIIYML